MSESPKRKQYSEALIHMSQVFAPLLRIFQPYDGVEQEEWASHIVPMMRTELRPWHVEWALKL